jgi:hypothetical protein
MFTVKHLSHTGGETLYEATGVSFMSAETILAEYNSVPRAVDSKPPPPDDTVWVTTPKGEIQSIIGGWVYVMNDHGATVAKYNLPDPVTSNSASRIG